MIRPSAFDGSFPLAQRLHFLPRTRPSRCSPISTVPSRMTADRWCLLPKGQRLLSTLVTTVSCSHSRRVFDV
jgi:hypothetical protein